MSSSLISKIIEEAYIEVLQERYNTIKEDSTNVKPSELPEKFLRKVSQQYGPVDTENDFFSKDLSTYFKFTEDEDDETGSRSHKVIKLPSFENLYFHLSDAVLATKEMLNLEKIGSDEKARTTFIEVVKAFNSLRKYLRSEYPGQYEIFKTKRTRGKLNEEEEKALGKKPENRGEELEDSTDTILNRFPKLKNTVVRLMTKEYGEFLDSIDWVSPRPSTFKINVKNGNNFLLRWTGQGFQATIMGKNYYLGSTSEFQQALDKLTILYTEGPIKPEEDDIEPSDSVTSGGSGGGGDFPGEEGDFEGSGTDTETTEEPSADLGGEEIEFEEPGEEPSV